jgi:hypothetical protein
VVVSPKKKIYDQFNHMAKVKVTRGLWMTRSNRLVQIESSREVTVPGVGGEPPRTKVLFSGMMKRADCKTDDSRHDWTDDGNYVNFQGVANPHDLVNCLRRDEPEAPAAAPPITGSTNPPTFTIEVKPDPRTDPSIAPYFAGIAFHLFELLVDAVTDNTAALADEPEPIARLVNHLDLADAMKLYDEALRGPWEYAVADVLKQLLEAAPTPTSEPPATEPAAQPVQA